MFDIGEYVKQNPDRVRRRKRMYILAYATQDSDRNDRQYKLWFKQPLKGFTSWVRSSDDNMGYIEIDEQHLPIDVHPLWEDKEPWETILSIGMVMPMKRACRHPNRITKTSKVIINQECIQQFSEDDVDDDLYDVIEDDKAENNSGNNNGNC